MDIPRKSAARNRRLRRIIYGVVAIAVISGITVGLARLKPAAPSVEAGTVWPGTVKRGPMLRQVRGLGTLVPVEIRWIAAVTQGRVERRLIQPGTTVKADTVILELSNPELEQSALEAQSQWKAAEADLANLKVQLESQFLTQKAQAATVQADYMQAKLQAEANEELVRQKLFAELQFKLSKARADDLANRAAIEQKRLDNFADAIKAQLAAQQSRVEQLRALYELRAKQVDQLKVRPGTAGVLQELPVQVGQQVSAGTNLARVADPTRLKAEVRIAETQAKDIQIGQKALVDTHNGIIPGHVIRIDPAVQQGTRTVDVALEGELPKGAVPDLSVDGTIELERLDDVLYVERPAFGQEKSTVTLFRYEPDGKTATRVQVKFGRSSVNTIEILEGLRVGDRVILSDMSQYDNTNRIRLN
jgi:HlyD family secretion protein